MRILIAIDQTDNWKELIDFACRAHFPGDAEFKILTVIEPANEICPRFIPSGSIFVAHAAQTMLKAEHILASARSQLIKCLNNSRVHTELRKGPAASQIVDASSIWMPDKIIIGAHESEPNRLLPGTVGKILAKQAGCSIETVKISARHLSSLRC